jgi:hypothetical protein
MLPDLSVIYSKQSMSYVARATTVIETVAEYRVELRKRYLVLIEEPVGVTRRAH